MRELPIRSAAANRSVLIIEDDAVVVTIVDAMLQELGYADIRHVDEVNAALLSIARAEPAVAILDAQLKGVVSYRVAAELAERGIPFVVGTSFDPASLPAEFQRGAPLRKPYTVPLLSRALADALASRA